MIVGVDCIVIVRRLCVRFSGLIVWARPLFVAGIKRSLTLAVFYLPLSLLCIELHPLSALSERCSCFVFRFCVLVLSPVEPCYTSLCLHVVVHTLCLSVGRTVGSRSRYTFVFGATVLLDRGGGEGQPSPLEGQNSAHAQWFYDSSP